MKRGDNVLDDIFLNERQKRFVDYYIQTGNATESAIKAGYSAKTAGVNGCNLLKNPKIRNALHTRIESQDRKRVADVQEVLEYLTAVMRGEYQDELAMNVGKGKGVTAVEKVKLAVGAKERLKAAEMLAKVNGLFINRQEVEFSNVLPIVIKDDI